MNRLSIKLLPFLKGTALKRGAIFGVIIFSALMAFEVFNFGTTAFALKDMLGDLTFAGLRWSTILAFAFCGIDFAGIARIFTPEQGADEPAEVWYLFGAWLLAAGFNAVLTWWGVSIAILNHNAAGGALVGQATLTKAVPIFVAVMVWLIRVLIIGTFSVAGERLFSVADAGDRPYQPRPAYRPTNQPLPARPFRPAQGNISNLPSVNYPRPAPKPTPSSAPAFGSSHTILPEPTYHPVGMNAMPRDEHPTIRS